MTTEYVKPTRREAVFTRYGLPQAGRRFQRSIYPWLRDQGFRQLDDSDSSVWVHDPKGESHTRINDSPNSSVTTH